MASKGLERRGEEEAQSRACTQNGYHKGLWEKGKGNKTAKVPPSGVSHGGLLPEGKADF